MVAHAQERDMVEAASGVGVLWARVGGVEMSVGVLCAGHGQGRESQTPWNEAGTNAMLPWHSGSKRWTRLPQQALKTTEKEGNYYSMLNGVDAGHGGKGGAQSTLNDLEEANQEQGTND
jgi:hypothetical protein